MADSRAYEYGGLKAEAWDLLRGDYSTWPDRPFYFEAIRRSGEPALDVGCGTGRLLLDYLAQDIDCEGVDNSPEMLALCCEKAVASACSRRCTSSAWSGSTSPGGIARSSCRRARSCC